MSPDRPLRTSAIDGAAGSPGVAFESSRIQVHALGLEHLTAAETIPLEASGGRTLAAPVRALADLPSVTTSAMDGWVVAGPGPWTMGGPIVAGDAPDALPLVSGTARPITTGGPIPPDALAVIRSERGRVDAGVLVATGEEPLPGRHVRRQGEEGTIGDELLPTGYRLTPPRIALAAVAGHDSILVRVAPRVDVLLLGSEVITSGVPGDGLVRDAYSPQLPALLSSLGASVSTCRRVEDRIETTIHSVRATRADLVISTGGTAAGATDHLRSALDAVGATIVIDGLDLRPGHPTLVATLPDGRPILCLPGNPLAAMMVLAALGMPLLDGLLGRTPQRDGVVLGQTAFENPGRAPRLVAFRESEFGAEPTSSQGSGMLRGLATSDGVAIVPAGGSSAGDVLRTLPTPW